MKSKHIMPLLPERLPPRKRLKKEKLHFLLGARDAEMDKIKDVLKRHKLPFSYAMSGNERVHPGNAYCADPITLIRNVTLVLVECEPVNYRAFAGTERRIDHHRENDHGFNHPPEFFWEGSSLGQLYTLLGKKQKPSKEHLIIAVRDHCRFKVRQCPGVTAKEVSNYGRHTIALELGIRRPELDENIYRMRQAIKRSHSIFIGSQPIVDLRRLHVGEVYSFGYLSLYEALADLEVGAVVSSNNPGQGVEKVVLLGNLEPDTITTFVNEWGSSEGLTNLYGNEARGYAGGYYSKNLLTKAA